MFEKLLHIVQCRRPKHSAMIENLFVVSIHIQSGRTIYIINLEKWGKIVK